MEQLLRGFRLAMRAPARHPGFALTVVLMLALGIGASSAVFNVVNGVLLASLPYSEPGRIVRILEHQRGEDVSWGTTSYPNFLDIRDGSRSFSALAAYDEWTPMLHLDRPTLVGGASVNAAFFDVLGVKAAVGRLFLPEEDEPGAASSVVITHALWANRFDLDPSIVGSTLTLSGNPYTVVGILPRNFEDPGLSDGNFRAPQVWRVTPPHFGMSSRRSSSFTAIGRLKPEVTVASAQAELDAIMARLEQAHPAANTNHVLTLRTLEDDLLGTARPGLWMLFGAVGLLLLIACVNVANLMLVRAANRTQEFGIRNALGASRWTMARQVLLESVVLSVAGGIAGLLLAYVVTHVMNNLIAAALPRPVPLVFDWAVLAFAAGVSLLTGAAASILPIIETRRISTQAATREGRNAAGGRRLAARMRGLVGVQTALTLALFLTSLLFARSLANLSDVDPGVRVGGLLTLQVDALGSDYPEHADITALYDELLPRVAAVPGVTAVGAINILPLSGSFNGNSFTLSGRASPAPGERPSAETRAATPGFFHASGIPLRNGRLINDADREGAKRVVVVNEAFARHHFPGKSPLGAHMIVHNEEWEIVGVVGDVHQFALDRRPEPAIYMPHAQVANTWMRRDATVFVRADGEVVELAPAIRAAIHAIAPDVAVENVQTMETVVASSVGPQRFRTLLLSMFAGAALLLGVIGIYGVVAYAVTQRTREAGVRMAVGARASQLVRMMVMQGIRPAVFGGVAGLLVGVLVAQTLQGLLFGVRPTDPVTMLLAVAVLGVTGTAACWLPARRIARVDPTAALRHE